MNYRKILFSYLLCITFSSCCTSFGDCNDDFIDTGSRYEPIFLNRLDFEKSIQLKTSLAIGTSGKIYVKDKLLFINELHKGFHVYDNSDPTNPKAINFLEAPGSTDLAVRGNIIYINQATDLIAINYNSETNTALLTKRIPNTFPPLTSPDGFEAYAIPENTVVVDWKLKN